MLYLLALPSFCHIFVHAAGCGFYHWNIFTTSCTVASLWWSHLASSVGRFVGADDICNFVSWRVTESIKLVLQRQQLFKRCRAILVVGISFLYFHIDPGIAGVIDTLLTWSEQLWTHSRLVEPTAQYLAVTRRGIHACPVHVSTCRWSHNK